MMTRTQISLSSEDRRILDAAAARTGRSIAALIRDAVQAAYGTGGSSDDDLLTMRRTFGSWHAHDRDGAEWVATVRSGSRLPHSS